MSIWTIAYLSLLSQIFALTKMFFLEHLFFLLRCLLNYFILCSFIYLFICSIIVVFYLFIYLFILSLACIFNYLCIYCILIHSFAYSYCILSSSTLHFYFSFFDCLVKHLIQDFFFHNKNIVKKGDLTYAFLHPDNSYPWRKSRDLGLSSLSNSRYFHKKNIEKKGRSDIFLFASRSFLSLTYVSRFWVILTI